MKNYRIPLLAATISVAALLAGAAQATELFNQDLASPGVYFGTGNGNGDFAVNTVDGIELGLRARPYLLGPVASVGDIYTIALGTDVSLDFSFNPGTTSLTGLTSLMTITNLTRGGTASFDPLAIPDNNLSGTAGEQNSERLAFGFLNGSSSFNVGDINYDTTLDSTYVVDWTVGTTGADSFTDHIVINQGAGGVPEPATWALMLVGFGGLGAVMRSRRKFATATA